MLANFFLKYQIITNGNFIFQVETAAKFLKNPKIASSPLAQKRAFLKSKGLTEAQIESACQRAGISSFAHR